MDLNLYKKLTNYRDSGDHPFHMPGHKRALGYPMEAFYGIDITEIPGFDNLHEPCGVLGEINDGLTELYGMKSYMLVNGSSCGILAGISAVVNSGRVLGCTYRGAESDSAVAEVSSASEKPVILMSRGSHQSVYNALGLLDCDSVYLWEKSPMGVIEPPELSAAIEEMEISGRGRPALVVLTSPTYNGTCLDIAKMADICHSYKVPLMVDAAHGAHFILGEGFPESATLLGADIVIHSLHKTLPSLTQTAVLHVGGDYVDTERIEYYLSVFQSSSPSYILMSSIGECLRIIRDEGGRLAGEFIANRRDFDEKVRGLENLRLWSKGGDPCKINIAGPLTGPRLFEALRERGIVAEAAWPDYVTLIATIMDGREAFDRLFAVLSDIDVSLDVSRDVSRGRYSVTHNVPLSHFKSLPLGEKNVSASNVPLSHYIPLSQALQSPYRWVELAEAAGLISTGFIKLYPPGIPIVAPGEKITQDIIKQMDYYIQTGFEIQGVRNGRVKVI